MEWRELIHRYFTACLQDSRRTLPVSEVEKFVAEFGSATLVHRNSTSKTNWKKKAKLLTVPPTDAYKVIESDTDRVVAEVETDLPLHLPGSTRFLVVKIDGEWKLEDYYWRCPCNDGKCFACENKGRCSICAGNGYTSRFLGLFRKTCLVCNGSGECTLCNGEGRCISCSKSQFPGWKSWTNLEPSETADDKVNLRP